MSVSCGCTPAACVLLLSLSLCVGSGAERELPVTNAHGRRPLTGAAPPLRLLLATANRLLWYTPSNDNYTVLHEGGVHYGVFPGEGEGENLKTIWSTLRGGGTKAEKLVEINLASGEVLRELVLDSRDTHDAVRHGDIVYVTDTERGQVLQLSYPSMNTTRHNKLFDLKNHMNTLSPQSNGEMYVLLHNYGQSEIARLNMSGPNMTEISRIAYGFGRNAHGLVRWQKYFLVVDSAGGALVIINPETGCWEVLYKDFRGNRFYKGLAVVDNVAYFGISVYASRAQRRDTASNSELAAYSLTEDKLLWIREVATGGLLNVVSAPQLGHSSTYAAQYTSAAALDNTVPFEESSAKIEAVLETSSAAMNVAVAAIRNQGFDHHTGGFWSSGCPYLDLDAKAGPEPWVTGALLPLKKLDMKPLQAKLHALPKKLVWEPSSHGHVGITSRRPQLIRLIRRHVGGKTQFFPIYEFLEDELYLLTKSLLGKGSIGLIAQLHLVFKPWPHMGHMHSDKWTGSNNTHHIYIPIISASQGLQVCPQPDKNLGPLDKRSATSSPESDTGCVDVPLVEGLAFEWNNRVMHQHGSKLSSVSMMLVLDVMEVRDEESKIVCSGVKLAGAVETVAETAAIQQQQERQNLSASVLTMLGIIG